MNAAAKAVVQDLSQIVIAYGVSDEYRSASAFHGNWPV
jgi:tRNA(His) 5'-end guanylyltransferase